MARELYISKDESEALTQAVVDYNKANNPIKMYNECFDYYVSTYNIKPVICPEWSNVIDIRKDYEYRRIDKSINRAKVNDKSSINNRDLDEVRELRQNEIDEYIAQIRAYNPEEGKLNIIQCPMIIWSNIEKIAKNYVENYRFYGYTYKEDLVMDSIAKCLRYLGNFSAVSSNNAFSYFTTIIRHSFLETIKKEYNNTNIKQKFNNTFYGATDEERTRMQEDYYECA